MSSRIELLKKKFEVDSNSENECSRGSALKVGSRYNSSATRTGSLSASPPPARGPVRNATVTGVFESEKVARVPPAVAPKGVSTPTTVSLKARKFEWDHGIKPSETCKAGYTGFYTAAKNVENPVSKTPSDNGAKVETGDKNRPVASPKTNSPNNNYIEQSWLPTRAAASTAKRKECLSNNNSEIRVITTGARATTNEEEDDPANYLHYYGLGRIKPVKIIPLKARQNEAISKDSAEKWEDRCTLLDSDPTCKTAPNKSPLMEKFRKLSEGKGLKSRARKETGAPLATDKLGGSGRTNSGSAVSNGSSMEKMDEGDDDDDDDDDEDDDDDSSEDSRRNKPPVPRKPTHLANKLNGKQYLTDSDSTGLIDKTSPNVLSKPPLTAAKSAGAALEQRRVTDLSDDQRTYDQVCFEDPSSFLPPPKSKNLERFLGMSPGMAQPIKSIKPCEAVSPTNTSGSGGAKGFFNKFNRRKSDNGDEEDVDGNAHYAVVDLHGTERTSQKKRDKKPKNSPSNALSSSPSKTELKRVSSGADTSKLSGDSGISLVLETSKRNSRGNSVPAGLKDPLDKTGSMDSDYVEGDSSDDDHYVVDSDFDHSEDEHVSKERPAENINFINQSHKVAYEVLTSERQFVDRLHLLHKVFEEKIRAENNKHNWFPKDVINVIFSNLSTIYEFHNKFLLPQLEDRMQEWERNPCLGDILVRLSPFLKLYTDYVSNFDNAIKCLNTWTTKVPKFASLLQDIQKKDVCVSLTLQHHMLEPVQRIPRYELLLKAYLKKLPEESCDRADSEKALGLISKAAQHSNDMMQTMEHFEKLLKLNERIDGESIIDPSRRLLKEGKITRVSARSGELLDRYLFLFNDMLLCCSQKRQITGSVSYKVKDKVDIDEVRLLDGQATRFRLERSPKSLEFETSTDEQKEEWMAVLLEAIKEMVRKKDSFKTNATTSEKEDDYAIPLGERMPVQIKDDEVTMCMRCGMEFNFTRRRHHCRACGAVVCGKCSGFTAPLPYDDNKPNRVCGRCNHILKGEDDPSEGSRKSFVDIDEHKSFCSYLWYLHPKSLSWNKYWVAATDQDLFALRAPKDVRAVLTLPIKLYEGNEVTEEDGIEREYAFKVMSKDTTFYFAAENKETKYNWLLVFQSGVSSVISPLSNGQPESSSTSF